MTLTKHLTITTPLSPRPGHAANDHQLREIADITEGGYQGQCACGWISVQESDEDAVRDSYARHLPAGQLEPDSARRIARDTGEPFG